MNKAVFFDRDGTLIEHVPYLKDSERVRLLPGVADWLGRLREADYLLVMVTNQSLVARGYGTVEDVEAVNNEIQRRLARYGVQLDAVRYCPHRDEDDCECRKPKPGMLLEVAKELDIDLGYSAVIGDSPRDIEAGKNAGCRVNVLVKRGADQNDSTTAESFADACALVLKAVKPG